MGATTTTTTTVSYAHTTVDDATKDCIRMNGVTANGVCNGALSKQIVDVDTEDLDNNNVEAKNQNQQSSDDKPASLSSAGNGHVAGASASAADDTVEESAQEYNYFGFKVGARLKWPNIIGIVVIHIMFLYTFVHDPFLPRIYTYFWGFVIGGLGGFGITGGVHRLWSHRSYKATTPLRIILMLCFSLAGQNPIYDWVRDHRVHHKFSETKADPHDSNRGFFFAHVGWLMMHKHPEVVRKGKMLDMSDILDDPVVQFHQKYFVPLKLMLCFILPTVIPMYMWNETFFWSFYSQCVLRYVLNLNFTWLVNSAAHMWGNRPYDTRIRPVQNLGVSIVAMGEGWHNYHHVFPWDYKAAELGNYYNVTTFWIEQFAKIGWAYDLKQPSDELIRKTAEKHGDNTHAVFGDHHHHHMEEVPEPVDLQLKYKHS